MSEWHFVEEYCVFQYLTFALSAYQLVESYKRLISKKTKKSGLILFGRSMCINPVICISILNFLKNISVIIRRSTALAKKQRDGCNEMVGSNCPINSIPASSSSILFTNPFLFTRHWISCFKFVCVFMIHAFSGHLWIHFFSVPQTHCPQTINLNICHPLSNSVPTPSLRNPDERKRVIWRFVKPNGLHFYDVFVSSIGS